MPLTTKHDYSGCSEGPCAVWETDDPALLGVQGVLTEPPEPLPAHEQHERIVLVRRDMLERFLKGKL
jgi:hypothetical protein